MTTDKEIIDQIGSEEYDRDASGPLNYGASSQTAYDSNRTYYKYKVWNPNPQKPTTDKTPGIVCRAIATTKKGDGTFEKSSTQTIAQTVRAVILFTSAGRQLARGKDKNFQIVCSSHDGATPSIRIDEPLCRKTTAKDVAAVISTWKGFDKAKVDAKVTEVTQGSDKLAICGMKAAGGFISLCPFARKDPVTGTQGACKQHIFVRAYDIDAKREFTMELTGGSMAYGKFIAPFHEFMRYLRTGGPLVDGKPKGLPSYAFTVELSAVENKQFFILNVKNWKPIAQAENREEMKKMALAAKEAYEKQALRLSKAAYDAAKKANAPKEAAPAAVVPPSLVAAAPVKQEEVSFEDDDIPF